MEVLPITSSNNRKVANLQQFLTKDQIKKMCSYAFKDTPTNPNLTDRYTHVNTLTVVEDLAKLGWHPVEAKQRKSKNNGTIFSKHLLKFQNEDVYLERENGERSYIEIILLNSHDGFTSFRFMIGIFRSICSNGLVIADEQFENLRIRHIGYSFNELRETIRKSIEKVNNHTSIINNMVDRVLTQEEKNNLALNAMLTRLNITSEDSQTPTFKYDEDTISEVLEPIREADRGDDLWTVFNVIQEKMIRGGFRIALEGKKERKLRKITSFERDIKLNQDLFKLATALL